MKQIIKFILHKYAFFIKYINRFIGYNKIYFFISHMLIFYFMKNIYDFIIIVQKYRKYDFFNRKYDNLKINKEYKTYLPYAL